MFIINGKDKSIYVFFKCCLYMFILITSFPLGSWIVNAQLIPYVNVEYLNTDLKFAIIICLALFIASAVTSLGIYITHLRQKRHSIQDAFPIKVTCDDKAPFYQHGDNIYLRINMTHLHQKNLGDVSLEYSLDSMETTPIPILEEAFYIQCPIKDFNKLNIKNIDDLALIFYSYEVHLNLIYNDHIKNQSIQKLSITILMYDNYTKIANTSICHLD